MFCLSLLNLVVLSVISMISVLVRVIALEVEKQKIKHRSCTGYDENLLSEAVDGVSFPATYVFAT